MMIIEPIFTLEQIIIGWFIICLLVAITTKIIVNIENKKTRQRAPQQINESYNYRTYNNIRKKVS